MNLYLKDVYLYIATRFDGGAMRSSESLSKQKYFGSFRIRLGRGASVEGVPKTQTVNIFGTEIYILAGTGERLSSSWEFSVKGCAFGWDDSRIEQIIFNDQIIFNENNARSDF